MFALDTNILVRYLVQDDEKQAELATEAIESFSAQNQAFITSIVLCEVNWVLKTAYKISKEECINILNKIITVSAFDIENIDCCIKALRSYQKGKADFSDYLIQEISSSHGYKVTLTFDEKALKDKGFQSLV